MDEDLKCGTSGKCKTFGNDCLASAEDFQISVIEMWSFSNDLLLE